MGKVRRKQRKVKRVARGACFTRNGMKSVPSALADGVSRYVRGPVNYLIPPADAGGTDFSELTFANRRRIVGE